MTFSLFLFLFPDSPEIPQIFGPARSNQSLSLSTSLSLSCEVTSLGKTQVQWLKQVHENQEARDKNKTIMVFDYVFEVSGIYEVL